MVKLSHFLELVRHRIIRQIHKTLASCVIIAPLIKVGLATLIICFRMFYWNFLCLLLISYLLNAIESSYELEVQLKNILKRNISEVKAVC